MKPSEQKGGCLLPQQASVCGVLGSTESSESVFQDPRWFSSLFSGYFAWLGRLSPSLLLHMLGPWKSILWVLSCLSPIWRGTISVIGYWVCLDPFTFSPQPKGILMQPGPSDASAGASLNQERPCSLGEDGGHLWAVHWLQS